MEMTTLKGTLVQNLFLYQNIFGQAGAKMNTYPFQIFLVGDSAAVLQTSSLHARMHCDCL